MDLLYKNHWERVYETKRPDQVSWTQERPDTSLDFIFSLDIPKDAKIIDIGGGDSKLADCLLDAGYKYITVLDISSKAIDRAKVRLGERAEKIHWVVSDILDYKPNIVFDVWHDRATFHFLTTAQQVTTYLDIARKSIAGYMVIGTFSDQGPTKCSGMEIKQYSDATLTDLLKNGFEKLQCITVDHTTPFGTIQNFLFCSFKRQVPNDEVL